VLSEGLGLDATMKPRRRLGSRPPARQAALLRRCTACPDNGPAVNFPRTDKRGERRCAAVLT